MRKIYKSKGIIHGGVTHSDVIMAGGFYIYWSGLRGQVGHVQALKGLKKESDRFRIDIVLAGEGLIEW